MINKIRIYNCSNSFSNPHIQTLVLPYESPYEGLVRNTLVWIGAGAGTLRGVALKGKVDVVGMNGRAGEGGASWKTGE